MTDDLDLPPVQHLAPELVLVEMAAAGAKRSLSLSGWQVLILSSMAGGFITVGTLFSTLIATGTDNEGVKRLLEGSDFRPDSF
jgi:formate/nitrite transporter FocA (FNT family)